MGKINLEAKKLRSYAAMQRIVICLASCLLGFLSCGAAEFSLTTPQNVTFSICTKTFNLPSEKLFYLTIAGVNANRFAIDEIQSKNGYVIFIAGGKEFLATISKIDKNNSLLKITPADNTYYFAPGIVLNIFKYIEINSSEELKTLPIRQPQPPALAPAEPVKN